MPVQAGHLEHSPDERVRPLDPQPTVRLDRPQDLNQHVEATAIHEGQARQVQAQRGPGRAAASTCCRRLGSVKRSSSPLMENVPPSRRRIWTSLRSGRVRLIVHTDPRPRGRGGRGSSDGRAPPGATRQAARRGGPGDRDDDAVTATDRTSQQRLRFREEGPQGTDSGNTCRSRTVRWHRLGLSQGGTYVTYRMAHAPAGPAPVSTSRAFPRPARPRAR